MAPLFVQQKTVQSTSSVSSLTTSAMTVVAGNALAVCTSGSYSYAQDALIVSDSRGDVFTREVKNSDYPSEQVNWDLATSVVGGSTTFTVTPNTPQYVSIGVHEFSGVAASPVEATGTGFSEGLTQNITPGVLSPPSLGDLYLSAWTHLGLGNESFTFAAGWTARANLTPTANMPLGSESFIGSGSQEGSAVLGGAALPNWTCAAMALRSADVAAPNDGDSPNFLTTDFPMAARGFG